MTQQTQQTQGTQQTRPKVVAAIPCFRTEHYIGDVVSRARRHVDQVVVIDDGSDDGTAEAARGAGATVVSHGTNKGYGEAIKSCFEAAKANAADVLITLDGDGQHNPDNIPQVLAPVLNGEADLIIGSRFLQPNQRSAVSGQPSDPTDQTNPTVITGSTGPTNPTQSTQGTQQTVMPRYRSFGISVITWLWNIGSKVKVSDAQSGFRAYSKKIFEISPLSEKGMSVSIETLEKARRKRALVKEVPISCAYTATRLNRRAVMHGLGVALSVVKIRIKNIFQRN